MAAQVAAFIYLERILANAVTMSAALLGRLFNCMRLERVGISPFYLTNKLYRECF